MSAILRSCSYGLEDFSCTQDARCCLIVDRTALQMLSHANRCAGLNIFGLGVNIGSASILGHPLQLMLHRGCLAGSDQF